MNLRNSTAVIERMTDLPDGGFAWHKTQDVEPVLDSLKELSAQSTLATRKNSSRRLLGSVPNLVAVQWAQEWGIPLYSKEWMQKARERLLNDPNWKRLRVEHQK